jgi:hypothetical protein
MVLERFPRKQPAGRPGLFPRSDIVLRYREFCRLFRRPGDFDFHGTL